MNGTDKSKSLQVIKRKQKQFQKEDNLHPGVFMLVFDSTSSSSGIRTIMETNQVSSGTFLFLAVRLTIYVFELRAMFIGFFQRGRKRMTFSRAPRI